MAANKYTHHQGISVTNPTYGYAFGELGSEFKQVTTSSSTAYGVTNTYFAMGSNANAVGSAVEIERATYTSAHRVYSDDGGDSLYGAGSVPDLRGSLSRFLITADQSGGDVRLFALMGQLKSYDGEWADEQVAGVHGYLELVRSAGTINFQGYGVTAGVMSTVETSGTMTLDTNAVIAGVAAISKMTSGLTQTGKTAGFYVSTYNTAQWSDATARSNWGYGLYVDEDAITVCPIQVGKFVASAAAGGGFAVTLTNSAAMRVYGEVTADLTSSAMVRSILGRMLVTGAITSNAEVFGTVGQLVSKAATLTHDNAGVLGTFEAQSTAVTISGTGGDNCTAAVLGRVGVTVTSTTVNSTGILAGVAAMSNITSGYVTVDSGGVLAGVYVGLFSTKQVWSTGLYIATASCTTDIRLQSGATIEQLTHLKLKTSDDTHVIQLNSRNYAATSGDIIGFQSKPAGNASGTQTVYGAQISPRFNDNIDGAALVGLQVEPILKGATAAAISGDVRGLDVRLSDDGNAGHTVGGITCGIDIYNNLKSSTFTGGVYAINIRANGDTQAWSGAVNFPAGLTGAADGIGAAVYVDCAIGGVAMRLAGKYVS